jgi:hypothetical protein
MDNLSFSSSATISRMQFNDLCRRCTSESAAFKINSAISLGEMLMKCGRIPTWLFTHYRWFHLDSAADAIVPYIYRQPIKKEQSKS